METLRQRLQRHEGLRLRPYKCTAGKLTIGFGRNIEQKGISEEEAFMLLDNDIQAVKEAVAHSLPWVLGLDEARRDVLHEMTFQMGIQGLLGFKNTLAAIRDHKWHVAAQGMRNSKWHEQTPGRANELADIMENGN